MLCIFLFNFKRWFSNIVIWGVKKKSKEIYKTLCICYRYYHHILIVTDIGFTQDESIKKGKLEC